ncbi:hypothetical protein HAX54_049894 [Datura stramonium]|uniref:Uncharacterized protein n=1 Tax=Datura stramonium TaxID=4076 RepID=A0ABS8SVJ2_DATST|nr:hypothetical protein [Datura stramonium]
MVGQTSVRTLSPKRGMHFKTVRGEGSKVDNFYKRRPGILQLVSESVSGLWWGKPDGGANLSEDAESQGGTRFKTVRGEGSKADNFYKRRPALLHSKSYWEFLFTKFGNQFHIQEK